MRTLFITTKPVSRPAGGGAIRNWRNMIALQKYGPVGVVAITRDPVEAEALPGFERHWSYSAKDYPRSVARALWLRAGNYLPGGHPIARRNALPPIARAVHRDMSDFKPDVVVFEELWVIPYLKYARALGAVCVFDNHNVEASLRVVPARPEDGVRERFRRRRAAWQTMVLERQFVAKADRVWVCSEGDRDLIRAIYQPSRDPAVIPNAVDLDHYREVWNERMTPAREPHRVAYVGVYSYPPNEAAALTLIQDVLPRLRTSHPDASLILVGSDVTPAMHAAAKGLSWVTITGSVPDVRPHLRTASVIAVPLKRGSGTRIKILEAFASKLPVVSSRIGADGLNVVDGEHLLLADDPDAMTAAVRRVWSEPALARSLATAGFALVERAYSVPIAERAVDAAVSDLFAKEPA